MPAGDRSIFVDWLSGDETKALRCALHAIEKERENPVFQIDPDALASAGPACQPVPGGVVFNPKPCIVSGNVFRPKPGDVLAATLSSKPLHEVLAAMALAYARAHFQKVGGDNRMIAALKAAERAGWKLVPVACTPEMNEAAEAAACLPSTTAQGACNAVFEAACAAAPSP